MHIVRVSIVVQFSHFLSLFCSSVFNNGLNNAIFHSKFVNPASVPDMSAASSTTSKTVPFCALFSDGDHAWYNVSEAWKIILLSQE